MDIATKITEEIDQWISTNKSLLNNADTDSISVRVFESRERFIAQLTNILSVVPIITAKIEDALTKAKTTRAKEISTVDSLISKMKEEEDSVTWTTIVRRKITELPNKSTVQTTHSYDSSALSTRMPAQSATLTSPSTSLSTSSLSTSSPSTSLSTSSLSTSSLSTSSPSTSLSTSSLSTSSPSTSLSTSNTSVITSSESLRYTKIKFTEALSINAIRVPTFNYVKQDGDLYYIECADHFAFKLAGHLFHGNIGTIYTEEKNPEKIKDCRFATSCMKRDKCDYYHDPVKFMGSKDCRNFIASSWLYAPPNSHYKTRPRSRRFGSREHLDTDIVGLQEEEISRFHDQTMHDLLCSLLLNQAYQPS